MVVMDEQWARTDEQRTSALAVANDVRGWRAALKREIGSGWMEDGLRVVEGLLRDGDGMDPRLRGMRVLDVVTAVRGYSKRKAFLLLRVERVSDVKTMAGLTERQRLALAGELGRRAGVREPGRDGGE